MRATILKIATAAGMLGIAPMAMAQGQQQRNPNLKLDRDAVALVGYDLNNDGISDTYYWVSQYDIETARRQGMSPQQARQMQGQRQAQRQFQQQQQQRFTRDQMQRRQADMQRQRMLDQQRMHQRGIEQRRAMQQQRPMRTQPTQRLTSTQSLNEFRGQITDVTSFRFAPDGKKHMVAKVELDRGQTVPVLFGPQSDLKVDLNQGKNVTFLGNVGRINDQRVIVAHAVQSGPHGQQIKASAGHAGLKKVSGKVQETRTFSLQGQDERHMLAKVKGDDGKVCVVDLGPVSKLRSNNVSLSQGEDIKVLATRGSINDRPVFMAKQLHADDKMLNISYASRNISSENQLPIREWRGTRHGDY